MNLLLLPYIFNIVVLVPVGLLTLFGGAKGGQVACQGKFPESEGFRTILGSLWTAIPSGSGRPQGGRDDHPADHVETRRQGRRAIPLVFELLLGHHAVSR